jgi:hypothetical protein
LILAWEEVLSNHENPFNYPFRRTIAKVRAGHAFL